MFGLEIIDISLGLTFVFLMLSLVCTAMNETIATLLRARSRTLRAGVHHLLNDPKFAHPDGGGGGLEQRFYEHPLIKALYEGQHLPNGAATPQAIERARPSYIPGPTFAAALLDVIAPATESGVRSIEQIRKHVAALPENCDIRRTLLVLMDEAGDDVNKLKQGVERWFDNSMERVSGWYKRRIQMLGLACAAAVTLFTNADTIRIAHVLASDPQELTRLLAQVQQFYEANRASSGARAELDTLQTQTDHLSATIADLRNTGVPLGWTLAELPTGLGGEAEEHVPMWTLRKLAGLFVTTLAVAMGAPFWFDLLNKFMTVRGVGQRPRTRPRNTTETK